MIVICFLSMYYLVLSSPAWHNWLKSGPNHCFIPLYQVNFRNIHVMPEICTSPVLLLFLSTAKLLYMGSFLCIVVKFYIYKGGDVIRIFYDYFRHSRDAWKHNFTSYLRFFRSVVKVNYINKCYAILNFKKIGLFVIYQGMWG